jgi:glycosyl transferase family (putative galactosyltransferase)
VSKALCSIGAGPHEALLAVSEPTFRAYAERHGYEVITSTAADPGRPPAWAKVPMIRRALDEHDLVLWIDADAVIVDGREDIAAALRPDAQLALVQHARGDELIPNTGVTVWRAGAVARDLLDRMWDSSRYLHHPWWENAALIDALGYDLPSALDPRARRALRRLTGRGPRLCRPVRPSAFRDATQFLPGEWNWTYLNRVADPRIMHCLAVPVDQRLRDMRAALEGTLR